MTSSLSRILVSAFAAVCMLVVCSDCGNAQTVRSVEIKDGKRVIVEKPAVAPSEKPKESKKSSSSSSKSSSKSKDDKKKEDDKKDDDKKEESGVVTRPKMSPETETKPAKRSGCLIAI